MSPSSPRPKRLYATGGRGRLASLIADYFRAPVHPVVLFSREPEAGFRNLAEITQPTVLAGADTILHLAWSTLPAMAEQQPGTEEVHDLPLLQRLLDGLATLPAGQRPHLVFFSSGGTVYGNAPGRPSREDDVCSPIGRYGRAKLAAERLIEAAVRQHGLDCAVLRVSNPYGFPVPSGRAQGVIPHAIRSALGGHTLTLWGDGHARKDFLYYTDFLSAVQEVVDRRLTGVFNIASGESHSVREIIALVEKNTGRRIATQATPAPPWDVEDSRLDPARFIAATEWSPQVSLAEGMRRFVAGYLNR